MRQAQTIELQLYRYASDLGRMPVLQKLGIERWARDVMVLNLLTRRPTQRRDKLNDVYRLYRRRTTMNSTDTCSMVLSLAAAIGDRQYPHDKGLGRHPNILLGERFST